jgi:hypothetical protein
LGKFAQNPHPASCFPKLGYSQPVGNQARSKFFRFGNVAALYVGACVVSERQTQQHAKLKELQVIRRYLSEEGSVCIPSHCDRCQHGDGAVDPQG